MQTLFAEELRKFNKIYREMDALYHRIAGDCGVSDSGFWVLYAICESGENCTQKDICELYAVSKQTIHSAIKKLENAGILYLESDKGRDKVIRLTEYGKAFMEQKIVPVISLESKMFSKLGENESIQMLDAIEQYSKLLKEAYEEQAEKMEDME